MQDIEPYFGWEFHYESASDERSPFYGEQYDVNTYSTVIYGYYIHPLWDFIGSETLYLKILFVDYEAGAMIIEFFGEWNDALHNDVMHLKRNVIDIFVAEGIRKFVLIGENVFNFHGSDDSYYEEWFEDAEDGWISAIGFPDHVTHEWRKYNIDSDVNYGGLDELEEWRTMRPQSVIQVLAEKLQRRLN